MFVYMSICTPAIGKMSSTIYHYSTIVMSIIVYDLINYPSKDFSQKEHFVIHCCIMIPISQFHQVFLNSSPKIAIIIIPLVICKTSFFPSQYSLLLDNIILQANGCKIANYCFSFN